MQFSLLVKPVYTIKNLYNDFIILQMYVEFGIIYKLT